MLGKTITDILRSAEPLFAQEVIRVEVRKIIDEVLNVYDFGDAFGVTSVNGDAGPLVDLDTSDIPENTNLYFTTARARQSISAGTGILYNNSTGVITNAGVLSIQGFSGTVTLDTDDIPEGSTNLYYSSSLFDIDFASKTTDDLAEGITNLYFTDTRARNAVIASSIVNGDITHSPDGNSVYDALALKLNNSQLISGSSGINTGDSIGVVVTQSGTAGYSVLDLNVTESSLGSGPSYFMRFRRGGSDIIKFRSTGLIEGAGLSNSTSSSLALIGVGSSGTTISRNIADTAVTLTVSQLNASSTGDILQLKNSSSTVFSVSQSGKVKINDGSQSNGYVLVTDGSGVGTWTDLSTIGVVTETDPVFTSSDAFGITSADISNWDEAYDNYPVDIKFTGSGTITLDVTLKDGSSLTDSFTVSGGSQDFDDVLTVGNIGTNQDAIIESNIGHTPHGFIVTHSSVNRAYLGEVDNEGFLQVSNPSRTTTLTPTVLSFAGTTLVPGNSGTIAVTSDIPSLSGYEPAITAGTINDYWRGDKSWQTLNKSAVGLSNVDNTSDATKNSATATLTNKTLTSPLINVGSDSTGDIYYRNGSGVFTRLPIGSASNVLIVSGASLPSWGTLTSANISGFSSSVVGLFSESGNELTYSSGVYSTNKGIQTLSNTSPVVWNVANGYNATITLTGNRTLSITNAIAGEYYTLKVVQDGTGSRTLTMPGGTKVANAGGGVVTLTTTAGAIDLLTFYYDGSNYYVNKGANYT